MTKTQSVDSIIGSRIRRLRLQDRLSQTELATELGVTFQQVQKYERGINQVSPTRLQQLAAIFGVPIGLFFDEKQNHSSKVRFPDVFETNFDRVSLEMLESFQKLRDRKLRRALALLTSSIVKSTNS